MIVTSLMIVVKTLGEHVGIVVGENDTSPWTIMDLAAQEDVSTITITEVLDKGESLVQVDDQAGGGATHVEATVQFDMHETMRFIVHDEL
jgi:hypothetical protein